MLWGSSECLFQEVVHVYRESAFINLAGLCFLAFIAVLLVTHDGNYCLSGVLQYCKNISSLILA